jgi:hypothetical protein
MHSAAKILAHIVRGAAQRSKKRKANSEDDEREEEVSSSSSDEREEVPANWAEQFNPVQNKSDKSTYNTGA